MSNEGALARIRGYVSRHPEEITAIQEGIRALSREKNPVPFNELESKLSLQIVSLCRSGAPRELTALYRRQIDETAEGMVGYFRSSVSQVDYKEVVSDCLGSSKTREELARNLLHYAAEATGASKQHSKRVQGACYDIAFLLDSQVSVKDRVSQLDSIQKRIENMGGGVRKYLNGVLDIALLNLDEFEEREPVLSGGVKNELKTESRVD